MKRIILTSVLLLMGVTGEALAACVNDATACYTQVTNLNRLLRNNTICNGNSGIWKEQEWHKSGSPTKNLIDYKLGPSSTNDPTSPVGEWSISDDTIIHRYYKNPNNPGAGTVPSSYKVWQKVDGTYDLCDSNTLQLVANVTIQSGQGGCVGSSTPFVCSASIVSPSIVSPAPIEPPAKKNDIQDKQDEPIVFPVSESDKRGKRGKRGKAIAFPEPTVLPVKESDKQGKPTVTLPKEGDKQAQQDKPTDTPAKEGDKQAQQDKPTDTPAKEGDKQAQQDKPTVTPAKEGDKQVQQDKPIVSPAKKGDKQGK